MKIRTIANALIIGSVFLIIYVVAGQSYVNFYTGGETELLSIAEKINNLCNVNGACPTSLDGWQNSAGASGPLRKGDMLYFVSSSNEGSTGKHHQTFRLVYSFFTPDSWFEASGGVGKSITSGSVSRENSPN